VPSGAATALLAKLEDYYYNAVNRIDLPQQPSASIISELADLPSRDIRRNTFLKGA